MDLSPARIRRVLRKGPRHVVTRLTRDARAEADRMRLAAARSGRGRLAPHRILPAGCEARTAAAAADLGAWAEALAAARAGAPWAADLPGRATAALRREVELFGDAPVRLPVPPPWNTDPVGRRVWPAAFHRRIRYGRPDQPGDVKHTWELNRLRHVVALAQAAAVTGGRAERHALDADLTSWRGENPVGWTVNWACAMEVALRAVNLVCADALLLAAGDAGDRRPGLASLYQHGWFLLRNLEVSDVNGNHFLADGVGLVWLGRYFDGLGESARWTATGRDMVRQAAARHVLPDGVDQEGGLRYHLLVLEMMLAARRADPGLAGIDDVLRRMLEVAAVLADRRGRMPDIGDDDGGRALALSRVPSWDARRVLALGAALLGGGPVDGLEARHAEDAAWLCGPSAVPAAGSAPRPTPVHLPHSGVVVLGDGDDHVVIDAGPVGFHGRGGHGHLDAMSLEATLGGALVVTDSGTGSYTGDAALRQRLRAVDAHNTVVLDGRPYARLGGTDRLWSIDGDSPPRGVAVRVDGASQVAEAEQDLPAAGGRGVHRRRVTWRPGRLSVEDRVTAPEGARVRLTVNLAAEPRPDGRGRLRAGEAVLVFDLPGGADLTVEERIWSRAYGSSQPGWRAVVTAVAGAGPLAVRWEVTRDPAPERSGDAPPGDGTRMPPVMGGPA